MMQIISIVMFILVLIRVFPLVVRIGDVAAISLRRFWWGVLIVALGGWLIHVLRARRSGWCAKDSVSKRFRVTEDP